MLGVAPDVHFLLVGSGSEREKVMAQAYDRGVLNKNLTIWGRITKINIPSVLAAATVAVSVFIPPEAPVA